MDSNTNDPRRQNTPQRIMAYHSRSLLSHWRQRAEKKKQRDVSTNLIYFTNKLQLHTQESNFCAWHKNI